MKASLRRMGDKRHYKRYQLWLPVEYHAGEVESGLAINRDIGQGGMLMAVTADLSVGQEVEVTIKLPPGNGEEIQLTGHIGRVEDNVDDPDGTWRHRVAVIFNELRPELEGLLSSGVIEDHG